MNNLFILMWMLFDHVFDDYFLQGCLADLKQKEYWKKHASSPFYKYDYIMALIMHSISWSFMIMLPVAYYYSFNISLPIFFVFITNIIIHAVIDHQKANVKSINLIMDQCVHITQIITTWCLFVM